jgi:Zn ribbon nucleic-acid-binding protein
MKCKKCNTDNLIVVYEDNGCYYIVCLTCNETLEDKDCDMDKDIGPEVHNDRA